MLENALNLRALCSSESSSSGSKIVNRSVGYFYLSKDFSTFFFIFRSVHLRHLHLDKISELEKHKSILLSKPNAGGGGGRGSQASSGSGGSATERSNVKELISYIECQRDVYKTSVENLLQKLDPERTVLNEVDSMIEQEMLERSQHQRPQEPQSRQHAQTPKVT